MDKICSECICIAKTSQLGACPILNREKKILPAGILHIKISYNHFKFG